MKITKNILFSLVLVFMLTGNVFPCGPDFDNAYLVRASKEEFLSIPEGSFLYELERITGQKIIAQKIAYKGSENSKDKDLGDLKEALSKARISIIQKIEATNSYKESRSKILKYLKMHPIDDTWYGDEFRQEERADAESVRAFKESIRISPLLPIEFREYMEGAVSYHAYDFETAINKWNKLLTLPKEERSYKSTWAAFMIGKAYLNLRKPKEAIPYFKLTRELALEMFKDSLNLSKESYGWQALAEYESADYTSSITSYLKTMDVSSINWLCARIFELDEPIFKSIVKDELSRNVLIGWAVSRFTTFNRDNLSGDESSMNIYAKLLKAIEDSKIEGEIYNADRIAWLYYINGDIVKSKKWLELSQGKTLLSQFIDVKIMLRDGEVDKAIAKLETLVPLFEKSQDKDMFYEYDIVRELNTEIGVLRLSRAEYIKAFDILLKGRHWENIAYVAEKVLTSEELENYLKQHSKDSVMNTNLDVYNDYYISMEKFYKENPEYRADDIRWNIKWKNNLYDNLIFLLARRFARENNLDKALVYMPTSYKMYWNEIKLHPDGYNVYEEKSQVVNLRKKLEELKKYLNKAEGPKLSNIERAKSYYEAGVILRKYGMELIGTELDPDGFVFDGGFNYYDSLENRFGILTEEAKSYYKDWYLKYVDKVNKLREKLKKDRGFFYGSEDEEKKIIGSLPSPLKRYHYRYKAAELMWKCAELLPDNDELKAKALCTGGTYLKNRDPKAADRFYKALVKKCGETELGKAANKIRWFPKMK